MHKSTSLTLLVFLFFITFISLVSAQQCGPDQGSCDSGFCCSSSVCYPTPTHTHTRSITLVSYISIDLHLSPKLTS
ncbi:hypothetical protein F5H01DRAFT_328077 [Linnemannia elongata]|nr:hypothetical protein F5H01DRAFT_328077 [Linnemannia elongata]